ncbi:MAG: hypothetical protein R2681_10225 [Pyrinomonadaceae bacterium]
MKKALLFILIFCIHAVPALPQTDLITVIEAVKIKNDNRKEALYYYENNWKLLREKALEKNFIDSFEMIVTEAADDADFDIVLITRYSNKNQFDNSEVNFQRLIKEFITDKDGIRLMNALKPVDFRKSVFIKTGSSYLISGR